MSIKKIAERVGVSVSTVSRVLNNPDYKCSPPEVRERIRRAAMELNYVPNEAARNLKIGAAAGKEKTYYINILMTRVDAAHLDPFFDELLRVVESEIHKNGCILSKIWHQAIFSSDKKCRRESLHHMIDTMVEEAGGMGDGLIVIGKCNQEALLMLKKKYRSIVCINRNAAACEVDEVVCDGQKIAAIAVKHLIDLGHTNIGYVGACHNEARYKGFLSTLERHGIEPDLDFIVETKQTEAEGYAAMERLLKAGDYPTGIYCANDITAVGMLKYLNKYKNRYYMPSIVSSDDIEEAQYTNPMLTTVQLPKAEMGRFALQLLLDRMRGGHSVVVKMELECKLLVRNSCIQACEGGWRDYCI